jgi:hypothetical protein
MQPSLLPHRQNLSNGSDQDGTCLLFMPLTQVIHARSGGEYEIMGVMYGKVRDGAFWIMDAAALPVQGTETRVNAGNEVRRGCRRHMLIPGFRVYGPVSRVEQGSWEERVYEGLVSLVSVTVESAADEDILDTVAGCQVSMSTPNPTIRDSTIRILPLWWVILAGMRSFRSTLIVLFQLERSK